MLNCTRYRLQTEFIEMYVSMGVTEGTEYKIEIRFTY